MNFFDELLKSIGVASRIDALKKDIGKQSNNIYIFFDIETTGTSIYYSEPVQISAIKVCDGKIVDKFDTLVKPHRPNPDEAIAVNHITNDMLNSAPSFREVYYKFKQYVGNFILVGYNIRGFDLPLLNTRVNLLNGEKISVHYIDLYQHVRGIFPGLKDYKLTTVAQQLGIDTSGAHNALSDCFITYNVFTKIRESGKILEPKIYQGTEFAYKTKLSEESLAINILRKIMNKIVEDKEISNAEFYELQTWIKENSNLKGNYPFNEISNELEKILSDGVIEELELKSLEVLINEWLDPVKNSKHIPITTILNKHFVITGDFEMGDKEVVIKFIESKGGIVDDRVVKKTEYVIVGALGSRLWVAGNYGTKIKKALEYKGKGIDIQIVREKDFIKEANAIQ
ncbi:exonuclease domain-containing protein [Butyrivibrio sp. LB2008]|uniref:exonuclease domain-containing protein n=1 Tax=Butyrivibrio sp. LB2008 TaxID=1408305 RepID=UPI0006845EFC|nr:exonuclease domain-containing protein [Butyrivibrio sp. LB2008]